MFQDYLRYYIVNRRIIIWPLYTDQLDKPQANHPFIRSASVPRHASGNTYQHPHLHGVRGVDRTPSHRGLRRIPARVKTAQERWTDGLRRDRRCVNAAGEWLTRIRTSVVHPSQSL
ncbi:hypothetical protein AB1N83_001397 [Pleurotus pulmonarius]